jgi:hypothetical protein
MNNVFDLRKVQNLEIYEVGDKPLGLSYSEWSERWWQWLLSFPKSTNPAFNNSKEWMTTNTTTENVSFLCQTIEAFRPIPRRRIQIPDGGYIFMPILNWISINDEDDQTDEELIKLAKEKMDKVGKLDLRLNGNTLDLRLEEYRVRSRIFEMIMEAGNVLDARSGSHRLVSDGYWIFLRPQISDLILSSFGSCSSGITEIGVDYRIRLVKNI